MGRFLALGRFTVPLQEPMPHSTVARVDVSGEEDVWQLYQPSLSSQLYGLGKLS